MVLERIGVDRFDLLRGAGDGGLRIAVLVGDERLLGAEALLQRLRDRGARDLRVGAFVPDDR